MGGPLDLAQSGALHGLLTMTQQQTPSLCVGPTATFTKPPDVPFPALSLDKALTTVECDPRGRGGLVASGHALEVTSFHWARL